MLPARPRADRQRRDTDRLTAPPPPGPTGLRRDIEKTMNRTLLTDLALAPVAGYAGIKLMEPVPPQPGRRTLAVR